MLLSPLKRESSLAFLGPMAVSVFVLRSHSWLTYLAGKTTLISILTGLYNASAGVGRIAGYDIYEQREQVYRILGVCPQVSLSSLCDY